MCSKVGGGSLNALGHPRNGFGAINFYRVGSRAMKIKIPREIYQAHELDFVEMEIEPAEKIWYDDYLKVDLTGRDTGIAAKLLAIFEPYKDQSIKGVHQAIRDVKTWHTIETSEGDALPNARNCEHAVEMLKVLIGRTERKHLYQVTSAESGSAALAYYVEKIEYSPPMRDCPASLGINMRYLEFGRYQSWSKTLHHEDVAGKQPLEILKSVQLYLETPIMRDDYEFYKERYESIVLNVGEQYEAIGTGQQHTDRYWRESRRMEDDQGKASRVVIDVFSEDDAARGDRDDKKPSGNFWSVKPLENDSDEVIASKVFIPEIPVHPYAVVFHLKKHARFSVHVQNLTKHVYDTKLREALVLPENDVALLDVLLADTKSNFKDAISGKTGGIVVLCQGPPGTGKTMTAEVYAESMERPLYSVQCSQLGIDAEELEKELLKVFSRANRWGAILLLDEADVYIHERGKDLIHNAIVGVLLRVLEYYDGILFMTTNRGDTVDDAILSRCTARLVYDVPSEEDQRRIWDILAKANGVELRVEAVDQIVEENPKLSGRDIKNLLKLCMMVKKHSGRFIDSELVEEMRRFKPTLDVEKQVVLHGHKNWELREPV